ncbi:MAG: hypothetical protein V1754_00385 [Pseudomonadota bacterium]
MTHKLMDMFRTCQALWLVAGLAVTGCKNGGGDFDAENAPYGERTAKTTNTFKLSMPGGTSETISLSIAGQKTIDGTTYNRWTAPVTTNSGTATFEYWTAEPNPDAIVIAGGSKDLTKTGVFDTPITLSFNPPVGETQTLSGSGVVTTPTYPGGSTVTGTVEYTLDETNVTVDTPAGQIHGVNHYCGNGTIDGDVVPAPFKGQPMTADLYYHPSYGIVAASSPEAGFSVGIAESSDCGDVDDSGYRHIRKMGAVDGNTPFELNTYDCAGNNFDADKNTHAAMLLELRWADETQAKGSERPAAYPQCNVEFGTIMGIFPSDLTQSSVSILHPEENGKGFQYWYAYVNQAAKNEYGTGPIAYHVRVSCDSFVKSATRATARIYYKTAN